MDGKTRQDQATLVELPTFGDRNEGLQFASRILNSLLDIDSILKVLMDSALALTGAERGFILLGPGPDVSSLDLRVARNLRREDLESEQFQVSRTVVERVIRTQAARLVHNAEEDPEFKDTASVRKFGLRSLLCVPLTIKGGPAGLLYLDNRLRRGAFVESDLTFVTSLADHAAVALDRARWEHDYQGLTECVADLMWACDNDLRLIYISPSIRRCLGHDPEKLHGHSIGEILSEDSLRALQTALSDADHAVTAVLDVQHRRLDGSTLWTEVKLTPYFGLNRKRTGFVAVARDISTRRATDARLRESEARFRAIFHHAVVGIVITNLRGNILAANPAYAGLIGLEEQALIGRRILDDWAGSPGLRRMFRQLVRGKPDHIRRAHRLCRSDGRPVWGQLSLALVRSAAGDPAFVILTLSNSSHRKLECVARFQEEERHLLSLEVHDAICQPLAAIVHGIRACEEGCGPGPLQEQVGRIGTCARELLHEAAQLVSRLRTPILDEALLDVLQHQVAAFQRESSIPVELRIQSPEKANAIQGLPALFVCRILGECLANVARHSKAARVQVELHFASHEIRGSVVDDGAGFEPGPFLTRGTLPRPRAGFGLRGMRDRAELLGGRLTVRSTPGSGTTIAFHLPVPGPDAATATPQGRPE